MLLSLNFKPTRDPKYGFEVVIVNKNHAAA
eukprot:SAG11_NODE_13218_length_665_cov_1.021201_1_plen_29_part_10